MSTHKSEWDRRSQGWVPGGEGMKWQNHVGTRTCGPKESLYEKIDSDIRCLIINSGSVYAGNKIFFPPQMEPKKEILTVEALEDNTMKS